MPKPKISMTENLVKKLINSLKFGEASGLVEYYHDNRLAKIPKRVYVMLKRREMKDQRN